MEIRASMCVSDDEFVALKTPYVEQVLLVLSLHHSVFCPLYLEDRILLAP